MVPTVKSPFSPWPLTAHPPNPPQFLVQNLSPRVPCQVPPLLEQPWGSDLCCYTPYDHPQRGLSPYRALTRPTPGRCCRNPS